MSETEWPSFERVPSVAFVDVDGTLLAETTTFLFADSSSPGPDPPVVPASRPLSRTSTSPRAALTMAG